MHTAIFVLFALLAGFLIGDGAELSPELIPLALAVAVGSILLSATTIHSQNR